MNIKQYKKEALFLGLVLVAMLIAFWYGYLFLRYMGHCLISFGCSGPGPVMFSGAFFFIVYIVQPVAVWYVGRKFFKFTNEKTLGIMLLTLLVIISIIFIMYIISMIFIGIEHLF